MKFVFSSRAQRDLQEIGDWIAGDDINAAARIVAVLEAKAREIVSTPLAFPYAPELRHLGVRKRSHPPYVILYRVDRGSLRILRIVDSRRDYSRLFR